MGLNSAFKGLKNRNNINKAVGLGSKEVGLNSVRNFFFVSLESRISTYLKTCKSEVTQAVGYAYCSVPLLTSCK